MKSYAVDSLYACVVVGAIFLMLPFFVPYEDDTALRQDIVGEYSIEGEEKPEVFTRIIDRVSSFYGFKSRKKGVPSIKDQRSKTFTEQKKLESSKSTDIKKSTKSDKEKASSTAEGISSASSYSSSSSSSAKQYTSSPRGNFVEYKGEVYEVVNDAYGNKYLITEKGPVSLKTALSKGGRYVQPSYNYGKTGGGSAPVRGYYSATENSYQNLRSVPRQAEPKQLTASSQKIASSKRKDLGGFSKNGQSSSNYNGVASKSSSSGGGYFSGNGTLEVPEGLQQLKKNVAGGGGLPPNTEQQNNGNGDTVPATKTYSLQDKTPFVGNESLSASTSEREVNVDVDSYPSSESGGGFDLGWDNWNSLPMSSQQPEHNHSAEGDNAKTKIQLNVSAESADPDGIIMSKEASRARMTEELLGDVSFVGNGEQGDIPDPWILPNEIGEGPGAAFYKSNEIPLGDNPGVWAESDNIYNSTKARILKASDGSPVPLAMIDGQGSDNTMQTMPEDTFYYKTASGLLGNNVVNVDRGRGVDLNKIDKDGVLVIVPEVPLAENLRKDGFKVAVFDGYIVTPRNLKNFYNQASSAVAGIAQAKESKENAIKSDIANSVRLLSSGT